MDGATEPDAAIGEAPAAGGSGAVAPVAAAGPAVGEAPAAASASAGVPVVAAAGAVGSSPALGDWVEYSLHDGPNAGDWRPALVVGIRGNGDLGLQVFGDGANDYLPCPYWVDRCVRGDAPGCWRPKGGA